MTTEVPECLRNHPDVAAAYQRYLANKSLVDSSWLRIAACGVYNAGKSSLLNVLVGQFAEGDEAFRTGAVRMTSYVSEKRIGDLIYVDTPGIDGAELDDDTAWSCLLEADSFLYAHRLSAAEFEQREIEFLRALARQVHGLQERLALVITQLDEIADETDALTRQAAIQSAFKAAVGFEPRITFLVSSQRFVRGTVKSKAGLVARSGIPELKAWISQLVSPDSQAVWQGLRRSRLETEQAMLLGQIQSIAEAVKNESQRRARAHDAHTRAFETAANMLVDNVRGALRRINEVS
jgi:hypothetical protein